MMWDIMLRYKYWMVINHIHAVTDFFHNFKALEICGLILFCYVRGLHVVSF